MSLVNNHPITSLVNGGTLPTGAAGFPTANLEAHYKFNTGITVTGAGVSEWQDQTANNRHLLQGTDTNRPAESSGIITFDGVDNYLDVTGGFTLVQPTTVYILFKQITWSNNDRIFDGEVGPKILYQNATTPGIKLYAGAGTTQNDNMTLGTYFAVASIFDGASSTIKVGATAESTGNAGTGDMGGFILGAQATGNANWSNIAVKEVLIYSVAHDDTVRQQVITYLDTI